jgi:hypothetical protein
MRTCVPVLLLVAALSACHDIPKPSGAGVRVSGGETLSESAPIDVAVAPVVNDSGQRVPTAELRAAFHRGLVGRRYSPLALEYVDRGVRDASYVPGSSQEQAALSITVASWDSSLWSTHGAITARIDVELVDARSGASLWKGSANRRFDFGELREHLATEGARVEFACETIASEILSRLPTRVARPGRIEPGA